MIKYICFKQLGGIVELMGSLSVTFTSRITCATNGPHLGVDKGLPVLSSCCEWVWERDPEKEDFPVTYGLREMDLVQPKVFLWRLRKPYSCREHGPHTFGRLFALNNNHFNHLEAELLPGKLFPCCQKLWSWKQSLDPLRGEWVLIHAD